MHLIASAHSGSETDHQSHFVIAVFTKLSTVGIYRQVTGDAADWGLHEPTM